MTRETHAPARTVQRYGVKCTSYELNDKVSADEFEFLRRQTKTRSLCRAIVNGHDVWFILNRKTRQVVTVLTPEQGESQL